MTNAIGSTSEPERAIESGIAKTKKALRRDNAVERPAAVSAPAEADPRGQNVDREA